MKRILALWLALALPASAGTLKAPVVKTAVFTGLPATVIAGANPLSPFKAPILGPSGLPVLTVAGSPVVAPTLMAEQASAILEKQSAEPGSAVAELGTLFDGSQKAALSAAAEYPERPLTSIAELKLGTYNVLNLFEMVGKWVHGKKVEDKKLKAEWQLKESAKAILESDLDIVSLQEVENLAALQHFNDQYLGGKYRVLLIEGNDARGIDVGFLVKKDLPFEIEHRTNKDELWTDPLDGQEKKLFSRDLPALVVRARGAQKPLFILLGTHYKSKRSRVEDDPTNTSEEVRRAQAERTAEIIGRLRAEFGEDAPIMLAGDFNGDIVHENTFDSLKNAGMTDALDLAQPPLKPEERVTHTYHPRDGPVHKAQMDGFMLSGTLAKLLASALVYRYRDAQGNVKPIPDTYEERSKNPSDHFPLLVTIRFQPLVTRAIPPAN